MLVLVSLLAFARVFSIGTFVALLLVPLQWLAALVGPGRRHTSTA